MFTRSTIAGEYRGDFVEIQLDVLELSRGGTVTAQCVRTDGALVALSVVVADTP